MTISLAFIRAVHFGSCLILQSVFVLFLLGVIPGWRVWDGEGALSCSEFQGQLRRLALACLFAAFLSGFLWIWFAIALMSGSGLLEAMQPSLFWMVLTQTPPGHVWLIRAGIGLVVAIGLLPALGTQRNRKGSRLQVPLCAVSATALTASLAWLGHAGAGEGPNQDLHLASDLIHLAAAGLWPAGLAPFAIFLGCFLKARDSALLLDACVATRKFSAVSFLTVGALFASGIANSYFLVGSFGALISSDYGLLLVLKIALACGAVAIGAWNLLILKSRLAIAEGSPPDETHGAALSKVARNVWIELWLASLVLLVVGLLGITPPATH